MRFLPADITGLNTSRNDSLFGDASFDKVFCLEAAFHLGPDGRRAFLEGAYRLLAPGGRLVLVDFVWRSDAPEDIRHADPGRIVRDTWRFEEFEPLRRYLRHAADIGYRPHAAHDWSRPVIDRFMHLSTFYAHLAATRPGRRLLCSRWPGLTRLSSEDWLRFEAVTLAHNPVRRASGYAALVLDRPAIRNTESAAWSPRLETKL
ncbi:SAM-dependent methyltransferase [Streptomyces sp. URMC 126]|uniref:SAM-dependent methyltransferase n=1 Tax=Streptomyces sp. URMC 126 TaxID=3423401 RepID=UPI003F1B595F